MPRRGATSQRTNIFLSFKQIEWLKREAKDRSMTMSELIRRAVDFYIAAVQRKREREREQDTGAAEK